MKLDATSVNSTVNDRRESSTSAAASIGRDAVDAAAGAAGGLHDVLQATFGLSDFRKGQLSIIESVLAGRDTMAVMPTGGGKSLCYQLPAVVRQGLVVVISPLISLMQDQVRSLKALGLPAGCLHSGMTDDERRAVFAELKRGGPFVLYLSPERVQKSGFGMWVQRADIKLFAIDESHCVSQWGHDFRQDYARLKLLRELRPEVPMIALTATATPEVLLDIIKSLGMKTPDRHVRGFYRPNLFYQVAVCENDEQKLEMVKSALRRTKEGRAIVYCGTRQGTEELAAALEPSFEGVGVYHAGLEAEARAEIQRKLDRREIRILCATNAFGMGIDYPDVRLVVHFQMPANIESFYQEMGRAGRDGAMSRCLLLYSKRDKGLQSWFITQSKAEASVISRRWRALDAITQFAEGGECRHAGILTYFRDSERIRRCGHCDICAPMSDWVVPMSEAKPKATRTKIRKAPKSAGEDHSREIESPEAEVRAEVLREWRRQYADENDIPAFIVFSNRTLIALANRNPKTRGELSHIYGFGPAKLEAIGEQVLAELRRASR